MKNIFFRRASIIILFIIGTTITVTPKCEAWEVEVTNSCQYPVNIYVKGEHLFWQQRDCQINGLGTGKTEKCALPGGICPESIEGDYWVGDAKGYSMIMVGSNCHNGIGACCWNVKVKVVDSYAACKIIIP